MNKTILSNEILLGIDFGETNIGLAFGRAGLTEPLSVISAKNTQNAIKEIAKIAHSNKATKIIIGLPLSAENKETQQSQKTRRFANQLKVFIKLPVEFVNEFETSKNAVKRAIASGVPQKRRRSIDNISAALILKRYYEKHQV